MNIRRKVIHGGFDFYLFRIQLFFCVLVALSSFCLFCCWNINQSIINKIHMKNLSKNFTVLFAAAFSMQVLAQREDKLINQDWSFRFSHQVNASAARRVDLPHTWNAQDALGGKHDYKRGIGNYTKKIFIRPEWQGKRLFYVSRGRIA